MAIIDMRLNLSGKAGHKDERDLRHSGVSQIRSPQHKLYGKSPQLRMNRSVEKTPGQQMDDTSG